MIWAVMILGLLIGYFGTALVIKIGEAIVRSTTNGSTRWNSHLSPNQQKERALSANK